MKKKIFILMASVALVLTMGPIGVFAFSENQNNIEETSPETSQDLNTSDLKRFFKIWCWFSPTPDFIEPLKKNPEVVLDADENQAEDKEVSEDKVEDADIDLDEAKEVSPAQPNESKEKAGSTSPSFNNTRGIGTKFTSLSPSGANLRYIVLTEDSNTKKGTVKLGWSGDTGPGVISTEGNGAAQALTNYDLRLPEKVTYNGYEYTLTRIGDSALSGLGIETIEIPNTVTVLEGACLRNNRIKTLVIPEGVTRVEGSFIGSDFIELIKFPTTITELGSQTVDGLRSPRLKTVYFPVMNDVKKIGEGKNTPFFALGKDTALICANKEQYEKWRGDETMISGSYLDFTYEVEMEFFDQFGKKLNMNKSTKKLYGYKITWEKGSDGIWADSWKSLMDWGTIQDLPALPSESELGYKANYWGLNELGMVTVDASGKIEYSTTLGTDINATNASTGISNVLSNKLFAFEDKFEIKLNQTTKKKYDGNYDFWTQMNRDNDLVKKFFSDNKGVVWFDFTIIEKAFSTQSAAVSQTYLKHCSQYTFNKNSITTNIRDVADSDEYTIMYTYMDTRVTDRMYLWQTPYFYDAKAISYKVDIAPADINFSLSFPEQIWNNQNTLPEKELNIEDDGIAGTISWDAGQAPQMGTKEYNYTFIPANSTAKKKTDKTATAPILDNYTAPSKKGKVEITYKEVKKYTVKFLGFNGALLKSEKVEEHKAATAPTPPVITGYRFVGWDKKFNDITSDITITAQYEKISTPLPDVGNDDSGSGNVNRPTDNNVGQDSNDSVKDNNTTSESKTSENKKNFIENKESGIRVETSNKKELFDSNAEIEVVNASKKEVKKTKKKLDDVIKVIEVILKEKGVRVKKILDTNYKIYLDAKDYKDYKNLKVWQNKDGEYKQLKYQIEDEKIVFECDALDTYVLTGEKDIKEESSFPWWIIVAIIAGGIVVGYVYKKQKEAE